jgi:prepilin-type N-terminal cleavage/methylation domain-containing protein
MLGGFMASPKAAIDRLPNLRSIVGFTLIELLVVVALLAILASMVVVLVPRVMRQADGADALARTRSMGIGVLLYADDNRGILPPLFPGQVLYYEEGRGGRLVTELADYLGITRASGSYLVSPLMPRAYAKADFAGRLEDMRVFLVNTSPAVDGDTLNPFGVISQIGQPPVNPLSLSSIVGTELAMDWMITTADRQHPQVQGAFWRANAPATPPLIDRRAVFRFDNSAALIDTENNYEDLP